MNKKINRHEVASCNWHITWDSLLNFPIKYHPVTMLEHVLLDGRFCWIETQLPIWMRLKISKDMERLLKVPDSGHREVAQ